MCHYAGYSFLQIYIGYMELTTNALKPNFRLWLQSQLMERCRKNPSYSLRSFSAFLDMEASNISQIISGKRVASTKVITRICEKLSVSPNQLNLFLSEIESRKKKKLDIPESDKKFKILAEDTFAYISTWYHAAIMELTFVGTLENNPKLIAKVLSLTVTEVKMAIERMIRLDLLKVENNVLIKTNQFITNFTPGFTSSANKEFQRQIIKKSLDAIDNVVAEEKDITSMTMAIDVDRLPEAKKIIAKFRRDLSNYLEDGEQTRVYNFAIQLYPISKNIND